MRTEVAQINTWARRNVAVALVALTRKGFRNGISPDFLLCGTVSAESGAEAAWQAQPTWRRSDGKCSKCAVTVLGFQWVQSIQREGAEVYTCGACGRLLLSFMRGARFGFESGACPGVGVAVDFVDRVFKGLGVV